MMEACSLEDMLVPEKPHGLCFQASWGRRSSLESNSAMMDILVRGGIKSASSLKIPSTCKDTGMHLCSEVQQKR